VPVSSLTKRRRLDRRVCEEAIGSVPKGLNEGSAVCRRRRKDWRLSPHEANVGRSEEDKTGCVSPQKKKKRRLDRRAKEDDPCVGSSEASSCGVCRHSNERRIRRVSLFEVNERGSFGRARRRIRVSDSKLTKQVRESDQSGSCVDRCVSPSLNQWNRQLTKCRSVVEAQECSDKHECQC